jgi:hypothetical protein
MLGHQMKRRSFFDVSGAQTNEEGMSRSNGAPVPASAGTRPHRIAARELLRTCGMGLAVSAAMMPVSLGAKPHSVEARARVQLRPGVIRLGQQATIAVSDVRTQSVRVLLVGATDVVGRPLPWLVLHHAGGTWLGRLPAPALRGVYPIEVQAGTENVRLRPTRLFLRVFARGTLARPPFDSPLAVVRWWVHSVTRGRLVALKAWPRPAFDRRETSLHRLFVVAYVPRGSSPGRRLGMFVTAFRNGYDAPWRFLEATVAP